MFSVRDRNIFHSKAGFSINTENVINGFQAYEAAF